MAGPDTAKQSILNKARSDKFILAFSIPEALKNVANKTERRIHQKSRFSVMPDAVQYSVFGAIVPTISVPSVEVPYAGQVMKASSHSRPTYDDVEVAFTVDTQFNNYWYIWMWLNMLNDTKHSQYDYDQIGNTPTSSNTYAKNVTTKIQDVNDSTWRGGGPKLMIDYQTDFTLYGLNEFNKKVIEFTYTQAFPVSLGSIDYGYRTPSEIESSFTFSFTQLYVNLL